jgi:putative secretion ATPase (PEP-CTERM system associated)
MFEPYFGFSAAPFQLSPDPSFFYGSHGHKRAHAYLQYGMYQSEGFIVLTGEVGAGKTTLIRNLLNELDPSKIVATQLVSTQLDAESLVRAVATAFGVAAREKDKAAVLAHIEAYLLALVQKNRKALLIVDEAQNLSPDAVEELRMLSNFQVGNQALLQSFLVGQPQLRELMRSASMQQLRQRVIAAYHLGPLDERETRAYIEHRLKHVGWRDDPHFEDNVFPVIYTHTGGIPRRINTLCTRVLLAAFLAEKHAVTAADVERVISELSEEFGEAIAANGNGSGGQTAAPNLASLEKRVLGVEKAVNMTVNLLRQFIRAKEEGQQKAS